MHGKTTGPEQSEQRLAFTIRNGEKMKTIEATIRVEPEIESLIGSVQQPQKWIVLRKTGAKMRPNLFRC